MTEPNVSLLQSQVPDAWPLEVVERKGLGHPDTLCDLMAENLGLQLSRFYLERFGAVLHHNVDKALLVGGTARPAFGGGTILEPMEIILAGRATRRFRDVTIPVDELAIEASRVWLSGHLRNIDPLRHIRVVTRIRETSSDLAALFLRHAKAGVPLANDTSFGVGFAPLDRLEHTVLAVGHGLEALPDTHPEVGEDIKVLGVRHARALQLVIACAFVGRHVRDMSDYLAKKEHVRSLVGSAAHEAAGTEIDVEVNAADGDTEDSVYLTVTGLSAEAGDDGQVGRGNRVNGLITPYRPMSLEAAAGKNPISHTGKLYNLLAQRMAQALAREATGVEEAHCLLLSRIGSPISEPQAIDIRLRLTDPRSLEAVRGSVVDIARAQLECASELWRDVLAGKCPVC
jgi:S-adenosylmethionine synthetase